MGGPLPYKQQTEVRFFYRVLWSKQAGIMQQVVTLFLAGSNPVDHPVPEL
jgi:hypothetical protein